MKFTVKTQDFSEAMVSISKIVANRNTYPILANVVVTANTDHVTLRSTDLDIELTINIGADVSEPGETTVPARTLADILRKFKGKGYEDVTFTYEGDTNSVLTSGKSRFQLSVLASDSFPTLKAAGAFAGSFEILGKDLAGIMEDVGFCVSTEETRYYLNGICFDPTGNNQITFVATDGHRMARFTRDIDVTGTIPRIIVPKKTVGELLRIGTEAGDNPVLVELSDTKIRISYGSQLLLSKLIEGTFPDYDRVTPKRNNIIAMVEGKVLILAADRVSTISSERGGKAVKLTMSPGLLVLHVLNPDHGEATEEIPIDFEADETVVGFNARYLVDVLSVFGAGTVKVAVENEGSPTLFTAEAKPGLSVVLMPMRV